MINNSSRTNDKFLFYEDDEYIEVEGEVKFPEEIFVAFAVCNTECGNDKFIVDGQTQICEKCGKLNFRTDIKKYRLMKG